MYHRDKGEDFLFEIYVYIQVYNTYVRRLRIQSTEYCGTYVHISIVLVPASETSGQYYVSESAQIGRHRFLLGTVIGQICLMLRLDK